MRTLLICHAGDHLNEIGLARWLASFSELVGMIVIQETRNRRWQRIQREFQRVGLFRFFDVLAFRIFYRFMMASQDRAWERHRLFKLCERYPELDPTLPVLHTSSPNSNEACEFIRRSAPEIMIARCKSLLRESVFSIPTRGTFVMHPGICPEYRNAHGCFWALVSEDYQRVGMTVLRVDKGVDTGPVYGYYTSNFNEHRESHIRIQHRVVFDNLDALQFKLKQIAHGEAQALDTNGRSSAAWGQPWFSRYVVWKWRTRKRKRKNARHIAALS